MSAPATTQIEHVDVEAQPTGKGPAPRTNLWLEDPADGSGKALFTRAKLSGVGSTNARTQTEAGRYE